MLTNVLVKSPSQVAPFGASTTPGLRTPRTPTLRSPFDEIFEQRVVDRCRTFQPQAYRSATDGSAPDPCGVPGPVRRPRCAPSIFAGWSRLVLSDGGRLAAGAGFFTVDDPLVESLGQTGAGLAWSAAPACPGTLSSPRTVLIRFLMRRSAGLPLLAGSSRHPSRRWTTTAGRSCRSWPIAPCRQVITSIGSS